MKSLSLFIKITTHSSEVENMGQMFTGGERRALEPETWCTRLAFTLAAPPLTTAGDEKVPIPFHSVLTSSPAEISWVIFRRLY